MGHGVPDILPDARKITGKRFGKLKVQEGSSVHVGMELAQEKDFPATLTQTDFTKNGKLLPSPPSLWAGRKEPFSTDYIKLRQCKLGGRPGVPVARIASRINALVGCDVFPINELARVVKEWQPATVLKYASPSDPWKALGWGDKVKGALRKRGERVRGCSMTLGGWPGWRHMGTSWRKVSAVWAMSSA